MFNYVAEQMTSPSLAATVVPSQLYFGFWGLYSKREGKELAPGVEHTPLPCTQLHFLGSFTRPPLGSVKELTQTVCLPPAKPQGATSAQCSVRAVSKAPEVSIIMFAHLFKLLFLAKALAALVP